MKLLVAVIALTVLALPTEANWGGTAGGSVGTGGFKPFGTTQIAMQDEDLTISLYRDRARVRVDYVLKNTGQAIDVKAGFPCLAARLGKKTYIEVEDYRLTANGKAVPYRIEEGELGNWKTLFSNEFLDNAEGPGSDEASAKCDLCGIWWLTSKVHFDNDEAKQVRIEYESLYEYSEGGPSDDDYHHSDYFRYLLSTASTWKGPIQRGRVTIKAVTVDPESIVITPEKRFQKTKDGFVWQFANLEPSLADNIEVSLNNEFYTLFNYASDNRGDASWYSFEGDKYYFDFHGYSAKASSEKRGYPAGNISDFDNRTAWVAGRNGGIDESLTLTLADPTHVDQIGIVPGYAKSKQLYFANNRIEQLEIAVNNGQPVLVALPDEYISFGPHSKKAYQLVDLPRYAGEAKSITLRVKKAYSGSRYTDTCVSEVLLRKRLAKKPEVTGAR